MKLLSFGAVLWDIIEGTPHIGGAPFNLAAHAARFGIESYLVSAVGQDDLARRTLAEIRRQNVRDEFVRTVNAPTGVVDVVVDPHGKPTFTIRQPAAWDMIDFTNDGLARIASLRFDVVCFGSLEQRAPVTNRSLRSLVEGTRATRFCDINLRAPFYDREKVEWSLAHADILKLNDDEARTITKLLGRRLTGLEQFCKWATRRFPIQIVCVTLGSEGCLVFENDQSAICPGVRVEVVDTVGSGDAFSAAFLSQLLPSPSAKEFKRVVDAGRFANKVGALVASRRGAIPDYDPALLG